MEETAPVRDKGGAVATRELEKEQEMQRRSERNKERRGETERERKRRGDSAIYGRLVVMVISREERRG